jgi:anti-sigma regulatory factor (Ser/Thr protein kinase)
MEELALHLLDIAENAVRAGATQVSIDIAEDTAADTLTLTIEDNGKGMSEQVAQQALDPLFTTSATKPVGLGLAFLEEAAQRADGSVQVTSAPGKGTAVTALFRHSHPDRQPLGDLDESLLTLIVGNPAVEFVFTHRRDSHLRALDTQDVPELSSGRRSTATAIRLLRSKLRWPADSDAHKASEAA